LQVSTLVTDRHKQIDKFMMKEYPDIDHCYDVWHASKGKIIIAKNCIQVSWYYTVGIKKKKIEQSSKI